MFTTLNVTLTIGIRSIQHRQFFILLLYAQLGYAGVVAGSGISQADKVTAARLGSRVALLARTIHEIDGISLDL